MNHLGALTAAFGGVWGYIPREGGGGITTTRMARLFVALVALSLFAGILFKAGATSLFGAYVFSFALLGLRWPQRLLEAFIFLVALGHRDFTYVAMDLGMGAAGYPKLFITEWVLAILLAAALPKMSPLVKRHSRGMAMVVAYLGLGAVLFWVSFNGWPLVSALKDFAVVYYSLFAVAAMAHIDGVEGIRRAAFALVLGTLPNLAGDILNYLYGTLPLTPDQKNGSMRNSFYYLASMGFLLPMVLRHDGRVRPWPTMYCLTAYMVVVLYCYSKTAVVAALVLATAFFVFQMRQLRASVVMVAAVLFLLPVFFTPKDKMYHFIGVLSPSTYLHDSRILLQVAALRDFSEYPYGIGFGTPIFGQHARDIIVDVEKVHAIHNSYLTILRRLGIEGIFVFFVLLFSAGYAALKGRQTFPGAWEKDAALGVVFAGVSCALFAYAHVALEGPFMGAVFWCLIGCMFVAAVPASDYKPGV